MYMEMKEMDEFVPLNWDKLSKNPEVWMVIKDELDKLSPYCMMRVITAAKAQEMKDKDIFLPVEYEDLEDSIGNSFED